MRPGASAPEPRPRPSGKPANNPDVRSSKLKMLDTLALVLFAVAGLVAVVVLGPQSAPAGSKVGSEHSLEPEKPNLILTPFVLELTPVDSQPVRYTAGPKRGSQAKSGASQAKSAPRRGSRSATIETDRDRIICEVFANDCAWAVRKSKQECSTGSPSCENGQYKGVMQMGSRERAKYGHGSTVREQAEAAKRYYDEAGRRPWGG